MSQPFGRPEELYGILRYITYPSVNVRSGGYSSCPVCARLSLGSFLAHAHVDPKIRDRRVHRKIL